MIENNALLDMFSDDKTILLIGSKGNGKTNTASVFMESLVNLGYEIWTNIHFFKYENISIALNKKKLTKKAGHIYVEKPLQIHPVKSLGETLLGIINSGPRGKAVFLDEAGIHASSGRATSKETNTIKDLNKIIRHFESCFVLLAQVKGDVPPNLREKDCDYNFEMKKSKGKHVLEIGVKKELKNEETGRTYIDFPVVKKFLIPLSKYPYDGKFPTGFTIDINLKETLDRLSEIEDSIEIMDKGEGERIIKEMINETRRKEVYLSTGQYAKKYGVSGETVRNWIKRKAVDFYSTGGGNYRILDKKPIM